MADILSKIFSVFQETRAPSFLPLWDIVDDAIVTTKGMAFFVAELTGFDTFNAQTNEIESFERILREIVSRKLEQDAIVQVVVDSSSVSFNEKTDESEEIHCVLREQSKNRRDFLNQSNFRAIKIYAAIGTSNIISAKDFSIKSTSEILSNIEIARKNFQEATSNLLASGIGFNPLKSHEILSLMHKMVNAYGFGNTINRTCFDELNFLSIREKLFDAPMTYSHDFLKVGDRYVKVLTLRDLPDLTETLFFRDLALLGFDFRLSVALKIPNQMPVNTLLKVNEIINFHRDSYDPKVEVETGKARDLEVHRAQSGQKFAQCVVQMSVFAEDVDELRRRISHIRSKMLQHNVAFFEEVACHHEEYFKTIPGMIEKQDRWRYCFTDTAADLLAFSGPKKVNEHSGLLVKDDYGCPVFINPTSKVLSNYNWLVFGSSGSGKSVATNMLLTQCAMQGPESGEVLIVDVVGPNESSYRPIADLVGGRYISVIDEIGSSGGFSPWVSKSEALDDNNGILPWANNRVLTATLILIGIGNDWEGNLHAAIIQEAIVRTYKSSEKETPSFDDLYLSMLSMRRDESINQERLEEEISLLRSFLASPYANMFLGSMDIDSDQKILILDLFGVQNFPEKIREAIAFCVIEKVRRHAFSRPSIMSYVVLDEVAQLLRSERIKDMIQELFSLARKYRTSVWAITQKYESYIASSVADTLRGNCVGQLFMSHSSDVASMKRIISDFGFTEQEGKIFEKLQTKKGSYSEILYRVNMAQQDSMSSSHIYFNKLRLELSSFDVQIVTSTPEDKAKQIVWMKVNPNKSRIEMIRDVSQQAVKEIKDAA